MKLVYIAGPYRADNQIGVERNILAAKTMALKVIEKGDFPVTPHLLTGGFENHFPNAPDEFWIEGTMEVLKRCDAIVMCDGWQWSKGSVAEFKMARSLDIPIYEF